MTGAASRPVSKLREVVRTSFAEAVAEVLPDETVESLAKLPGAIEKVVEKCFKEASRAKCWKPGGGGG